MDGYLHFALASHWQNWPLRRKNNKLFAKRGDGGGSLSWLFVGILFIFFADHKRVDK